MNTWILIQIRILNADTDSDLATQFHAEPTGPRSATQILAQVTDSISYLALKGRGVGSLDPVHPCLVPDHMETVHTAIRQKKIGNNNVS